MAKNIKAKVEQDNKQERLPGSAEFKESDGQKIAKEYLISKDNFSNSRQKVQEKKIALVSYMKTSKLKHITCAGVKLTLALKEAKEDIKVENLNEPIE
jgi:hypothetical protein